MNKICVATGWCAHAEPRTNTLGCQTQYDSNYLHDVWYPQITKYIQPSQVHIYLSRCDIYPLLDLNWNYVHANTQAKEQAHRRDWFSSIMTGAQYAFCNGMDLLFIEQDALVNGLDKAIEWAQGKKIVYGFGELQSLYPEWAEQSFMLVSREYIPKMLWELNSRGFHEHIEKMKDVPERIWARLFNTDADFWPFHGGRLRPCRFDQEFFSYQQLTEEQIKTFQDMQ